MASIGSIGIKNLMGNDQLLYITIFATKGMRLRVFFATKLFAWAGKILKCRVEVMVIDNRKKSL